MYRWVLFALLVGQITLASDSRTQGIQYLQSLERQLKNNTSDPTLRLARLRSYYFLSVAEKDSLAPAWSNLQELRGVLAQDLDSAYAGALHVVEAKHALWPPAKLDALKLAQPLLDNAVQRSPHNAEIRYLRLMSCYYLPFFFGRKWSVQADFKALAQLLPTLDQSYPPGLIAEIAAFVLKNAPELTAKEIERLRHKQNQAIEALRTQDPVG